MVQSSSEEDNLVMAMPRRELFSISGFRTDVELRVIESIAEESWFADARMLRDDIDAKEVRLGMLFRRQDQWLVGEDGHLLHTTPVPPGAMELAEGVRSLRELARLASRQLLQESPEGVQLFGYLNDDGLPEIRPFFILVYLVQVATVVTPPTGMAWVSTAHLRDLPLEPVSIVVAEGLP